MPLCFTLRTSQTQPEKSSKAYWKWLYSFQLFQWPSNQTTGAQAAWAKAHSSFVTLLFEPHVELTVLYASHDAINKKIFVCSAIVAMCDRQMLVVPIRVGRKRVNDLQERFLQPHRHLPFNPSGVVTAAGLGTIQRETEIRPLRAIFISSHFCGFSEYLGCQLEKYS